MNPNDIYDESQYGIEPIEEDFEPEFFPQDDTKKISDKLLKLIDSINVAEDLDDDDLQKIATRSAEGLQVDEKSCEEWLQQTKSAIELATQKTKEKSFPWRGAANIKLPTITDAAIKFAARAYSEIIKDDKVVKAKVIGEDPQEIKSQRAERVSDYMSWQLIEKEKEWEVDTDKLLHVLPIVGHMYRKRYYCTAEKRTKSELCMPDKVIVNADVSSLGAARRVTHVISDVPKNEVIGNQRSGIWRDVDLRPEEKSDKTDHLNDSDDFCFYEQHRYLDLDEDGYEEPYIVTFEKETNEVVRIVANFREDGVEVNDSGEVTSITPKISFIDYVFIPSLEGKYHGIGFGHILEPLTRVANTLINQITDSGALNNMQAGYLSKEIKVTSGRQRFELGEWKRTQATAEQLSRGIFPLPTREPSGVLFSLLGMILDLTNGLASIQDVLTGEAPGMNVPATTVMALIEQGMKTYNAIYKRIYRSLRREYQQLYRLNYEYLDEEEYFNVLDSTKIVLRDDFQDDDLDIIPVADPNLSTDMQRLARAEALRSSIGSPGIDPVAVNRKWLEAMKIPDDEIAEIMPEQDPNGVPPHIQQMMHDAEKKMADVELKERELSLKEKEIQYKAVESMSKALKNIADAEAAESGAQLAMYQQHFEALAKIFELDNTNQKMLDLNQQNQTPAEGVQNG